MRDLERFLTDLQSPYWWLTAVALALGLNLASSYLKPAIDRRLEGRVQRRRAAVERSTSETQLWAKFLLQDDRLLNLAQTRLVVLRVKVLTLAVVLVAEFAATYMFAATVLAFWGWLTMLVIGTAIAVQSLALLWGVQEAESTARRLEYVQQLLQERILGPTQSNGSGAKE